MSSDHRWALLKGTDGVPIVICMNIPQQLFTYQNTVRGFASYENLKQIGFDIIVTCCTEKELQHISSICNVLKLIHYHIPHENMVNHDNMNKHMEHLTNYVKLGKKIVLCCPNGIGNTGVVAGALSVYMYKRRLLEHTLISSNNIVSLLRHMGPPNVIETASQYTTLMYILGIPENDIYPWDKLHDPNDVIASSGNYMKQYSKYQSSGILFPIMMNEFVFSII